METFHAYMAGVIDSDGYIGIGRKKGNYVKKSDGLISDYYSVYIGLAQVTPDIPRLLQEHFPGYHYEYDRQGNYQRRYSWQANSLKARAPIEAVLRYLVLKRPQAELALEMLDLMAMQNAGRDMGVPLSAEEEAKRYDLFLRSKQLTSPRKLSGTRGS